MKRLHNNVRNAGIKAIDLDPETFEEFKNKLFTALKKFSSSRKTRAVHKLIENNVVVPAIFTGATSDFLVATYMNNSTLGRVLLNTYLFDDALDAKGAVNLAQELDNIDNDIQREKSYIKEEQIKNIEVLTERKKETAKKFLNSLDYLKIIDGIYFAWLLALSTTLVDSNDALKNKVVTTAADVLADTIKKLYMKVNKSMDGDIHQLIEAISIYFIYIYFYSKSSTYTLNLMKKAFKEETLETIKMSKVTKFNDFNDLGNLIKETGLISMTPNTFKLQMENMFGKYGYNTYVSAALDTFIAFMANLAYPTQLFKDSYSVNDDSHKRLEELILNMQKKFKIKKYEI